MVYPAEAAADEGEAAVVVGGAAAAEGAQPAEQRGQRVARRENAEGVAEGVPPASAAGQGPV